MHPIIILDGPDAAGKTTVADYLHKQHNFRVLHLTYKYDWHKRQMHRYMTAALRMALMWSKDTPVIIDRFWASELTYANAYRGGSPWPLMWRFLQREVYRHGIYTMWCLPKDKQAYLKKWAEVRARRPGHEWKSDRDKVHAVAGMERVYDEYYRLMYVYPGTKLGLRPGHDSDYDVVVYDWTQWPDYKLWENYLHRIVKVADLRRASAQDWAPETIRITGQTDPEMLWLVLVGDRSNFKGRQEVPPFFEYRNSSLYLTDALDRLSVREDKIALVNPYDPIGTLDPDVYDWLKHLQATTDVLFCALGLRAAKVLEDGGIPYYFIQHPQYYARFNQEKGRVDLLNIIKETGLL